ncbi:MAG TPA: 3-deoxy-D-manno-octulosonic acid transferase [Candidatus Polarisedimenticolia bacterium]|jgi:3-deoxy-D-manno-octulosonic-acid transferase|nr:3-deoxy-D-manno-octulosonic acid transferase [Candidatus Polarisedimenticolia bacterium]
MVWIYSALLALAAAASLPFLLVFSLRDADLRRHWGERLGGLPLFPPGRRPLWVHAASVGEVVAGRRILQELEEISPGIPILLSSTTPAGRRHAAKSVDAGSRAAFFPLDLGFVMRRSLGRLRPRALVLIETEIWPNLLRECRRARIPVILVNGRISERSFPRYRRIRPLIESALARVELFAMQTERDAGRIQALGAPPGRTRVLGNVKWDLAAGRASAAEARRRLGWPAEAPVLVAGSTSEGEEEILLPAWTRLRSEFPELRFLLAPRHPHRFERVATLLAGKAIPFARRSAGEAREAPVLLLDTIGELAPLYAAATICFVGGSLVPRGGQNLMEPAAAGRPVLFGPRTENFAAAAEALLEAGAGFRVDGADSLEREVGRLLRDPAACQRAGERALAVVAQNRGAARRSAEAIAGILARGDR